MLAITPEYRQKLKVRLASPGEEGFRQYPYPDSEGNVTIGFGRNLDAVGISHDEALMLMENDLMRCEHDLWKCFPEYTNLSEIRKCVILEMSFNMGVEGVMKFRGMINALNHHDYAGAAKEMRNSDWYRLRPGRADFWAIVMESGVWP